VIGYNNSFYSHLKSENTWINITKLYCHSSAIIANKACEKLSQSCENLIRSIATHISNSAKRCAILLNEFQDFFHIEHKKILKLCNKMTYIRKMCSKIFRKLGDPKTLFYFGCS